MSKSSEDKDRQRLLAEARRKGVKVRRGAPAQEIDAAIQQKFHEDHEAIRTWRSGGTR